LDPQREISGKRTVKFVQYIDTLAVVSAL